MKTAKKALLLISCAVLLVVASVVGTMAYLTSKDTVTNTFTVGKVKIELDEARVKTDGTYVTVATDRVKANEYKLVPGHSYIKDPTVTVKYDSENSYVRVLVTVKNIDNLRNVFTDPKYYTSGGFFRLEELVDLNKTEWTFNGYTANGNDGVYEFRYNYIVGSSDTDTKLAPIFNKITVPGEDVTSENINNLKNVQIDVEAHAIQAYGFADADAAWNAFK